MILEKLHIIITLIAGLIVTIVDIIYPVALAKFGLTLIITIVVFYCLGRFVRDYLLKLKWAMERENEEDDMDYLLDTIEEGSEDRNE